MDTPPHTLLLPSLHRSINVSKPPNQTWKLGPPQGSYNLIPEADLEGLAHLKACPQFLQQLTHDLFPSHAPPLK